MSSAISASSSSGASQACFRFSLSAAFFCEGFLLVRLGESAAGMTGRAVLFIVVFAISVLFSKGIIAEPVGNSKLTMGWLQRRLAQQIVTPRSPVSTQPMGKALSPNSHSRPTASSTCSLGSTTTAPMPMLKVWNISSSGTFPIS